MTGVAAAGGDAAGEATQGGEAQGGQDFSQISQILSDLQGGQRDLMETLKAEPWKQPDAPPEPEAAPDLSEFLNIEDPNWDPNAVADNITSAMQKYADQQVQQAVGPLQKEWAEHKTALEAQALVGQYPEMADPQVHNAVFQSANEMAEAMGQPELANQPKFWGLVYAASLAHNENNQQGTESSSAAHLEGGGGSGPATGNQANPAASFGLSGAKRVLPFG